MKSNLPIRDMRKFLIAAAVCLAAALFAGTGARAAAVLTDWDFSKGAQGWTGNGYLRLDKPSPDGVRITSIGVNPLMRSPLLHYPAGQYVRVTFRLKTEAGAQGAIYLGKEYNERERTKFAAPDGEWREYSYFLLSPGADARFWISPMAGAGRGMIAWVRVTSATPITPPEVSKPARTKTPAQKTIRVSAGEVEFVHYGRSWDDFAVIVGGAEMASAYSGGRIGVMVGGKPEWLDLSRAKFKISKTNGALLMTAEIRDTGGALWKLKRRVAAGAKPGALSVATEVSADRDRDATHIPWLTLLPGLGTYGEHKKQALFAGLEYLADEPSSSEADLIGPDSERWAPDPVKITFPLMALAAKGKYVGVIWKQTPDVAAIFDTPDRVLKSGASLMALWAPGVGDLRRENDIYAFDSFRMRAGVPIKASYTIIGGAGDSVVPAVKQYVALEGLPPVPYYDGGFPMAVEILSQGWLDSGITADGMWRHALWGASFQPGRAAEASALMARLAEFTGNTDLSERLRAGLKRGLARLSEIDPATGRPYDPNFRSGISHVRFPVAPLIFGRAAEYVADSSNEARNAVSVEFDTNGIRHYKPAPGRPDFGKTHFADHAGGFAATTLASVLEAAWLSGEPDLIKKALRLLDQQTPLYANTEPRGAQTWEIPLHTPDILASAYQTKIYTLGYAMSGKKEYLEQARYWAWTGVPFVYLKPPAPGAVGNYATIAVYGATNWGQPVWIGLPVQWCGLVYGSALHELAVYDPDGPWLRIAKGITATGLQMSYPVSNRTRVGLLPDSYSLKSQTRNGPDINPGTVESRTAELYGAGTLYAYRRLPRRGWHISAPCGIRAIADTPKEARFIVNGFGNRAYSVIVSHLDKKPARIETRPPKDANAIISEDVVFKANFIPEQKLLILENLVGPNEVTLGE